MASPLQKNAAVDRTLRILEQNQYAVLFFKAVNIKWLDVV